MSNIVISPAQVKAARALLAWSQHELATAAKVSPSTIADFERAARTPVPNNATAIRDALETQGLRFTAGGVVPAGERPGAGGAKRPGTVMRWVSATDLVAWAARIDGKANFPELINRLIYADTGPAAQVSFPSGDSINYHGWDGTCWVGEAHAFIPLGQSGWELGAQRDNIQAKADGVYKDRTADPQGLDPSATTFIFVTLQRWARKRTWAEAKRKEGAWADVRALDADDLVQWLETAPAVTQWLAQQIGRRPEGLTDLADVWREWSHATDPALSEELLLVDREDDATAVHKWLEAEPSLLSVQAEAPQEAVAFLHACLSRYPERFADAYKSTCVVARTEGAARALIGFVSSLIVVLDMAPVQGLPERLVESGHRVYCAYGPEVDGLVRARRLARPWRYHLQEALQNMGFDEAHAHAYATGAGRSIAVLRRILPATFHSRPVWAENPPSALIAAMLAGAWRADCEGDREILAELAGQPYAALEIALAPLAARVDAPVRKIGQIWRLTSLRDLWMLLGGRVTDGDVRRLEAAFQGVLGSPDPGFDVSAMDRWLHAPLTPPTRPSEDLRRGLIEAMTALAVLGEAAVNITDPARRADAAVATLLGNADERLWWSLSEDLQRLAEVSPKSFMRAVDNALLPPAKPLMALFRSEQGPMTTQEYQANLLWALELLAWSEELFPRAGILLARLVAEDPGGRTGNRPASALRRVFVSWYPQTYAPLARRLDVIDRIVQEFPAVGWNLLLQLAPQLHDTSDPSPHPVWRDFMPDQVEPVTQHAVYKANSAIERRLLDNVGEEVGRWLSLLDSWTNFSPAWRENAVQRLTHFATALNDPAAREPLRDRLRSLIRKHINFVDADWAMSAEELTPLQVILDSMTIGSAVERWRWAFQATDQFMSPSYSYEEMNQRLVAAQAEAAVELLDELDDASLLAFAETIRFKVYLGMGIGQGGATPARKQALLRLALDLDGETGSELSRGLLIGLYPDAQSLEALWSLAIEEHWSERALLRIALAMPVNEATWKRLDAAPAAVKAGYWATIEVHGVDRAASFDAMGQHLIEAGRARALVWLLGHRIQEKPPAALLIEALTAATGEALGTDSNDVVMFSYFLGIILDHLENDPSVSEFQLVELEWQYFALLRHGTRPPRRLSKALATYPEFFVQLLCLMWRPSPESGVEEPEPENQQNAEALASRAYQVLHQWDHIPGADDNGAIDAEALDTWMKAARDLCRSRGREEAGDRQIGDILSAAAGKGIAAWPPKPIREALERYRSAPLERGFELGVYNRHGVTVRAPLDGGGQERDWAEYFRAQARAFAVDWERTSDLMDRLAEHYEADAKRQDEWTEQRQW
jgi:transcriptional regulator with XRE-family HTH domain